MQIDFALAEQARS